MRKKTIVGWFSQNKKKVHVESQSSIIWVYLNIRGKLKFGVRVLKKLANDIITILFQVSGGLIKGPLRKEHTNLLLKCFVMLPWQPSKAMLTHNQGYRVYLSRNACPSQKRSISPWCYTVLNPLLPCQVEIPAQNADLHFTLFSVPPVQKCCHLYICIVPWSPLCFIHETPEVLRRGDGLEVELREPNHLTTSAHQNQRHGVITLSQAE